VLSLENTGGRVDVLTGAAAAGEDARERSPWYAQEHERPRTIALPLGQMRGG
jgi:hypothetical protein